MTAFHRLSSDSVRLKQCFVVMTGLFSFLGTAGMSHAQNEPYPVFGTSWVSKMGVASAVQYWPQVMVPMRDGVRLSTDILLPKGIKPPYPTVLVRTPYRKSAEVANIGPGMLWHLINHGYAVVVQNERGAFPSEGEYHWLSNARHDGYDTVEWLAKQPWSNGRVATYGCSSPAENQLALSAANPPGLVAMIPKAAGAGVGHFPGTWSQGDFYYGGIPSSILTQWYAGAAWIYRLQTPKFLTDRERSRLVQFYLQTWGQAQYLSSSSPAFWHLPVKDILRTVGEPKSDWDTFILRAPADAAWRHSEMLTMYDHPREPALLVTSWYDPGIWAEVKEFEYEQRRVPDQFLIVGPTGHCGMGTETSHTVVGEEDVGDARFDYDAVYMQWFNHWLKGEHDGALSRPKVEYYLENGSKWLTAASWPPPTVARRFYLNSGSLSANSEFGDGRLETRAPGRPGSDSYLYDPAAPVPTINSYSGPKVIVDQDLVAERHDVLVYTSAPLKRDLNVVGSVTAKLYVSTDVKDTDLMLRLVDVSPDGRAYNVGRHEQLRLRYRNGFRSPELMTPGKVYLITLRGMVTATRFRRGDRIRIQITSSDFPMLYRNLNTGGDNETGVRFEVADVHIYHGGTRASYVTLPVLAN